MAKQIKYTREWIENAVSLVVNDGFTAAAEALDMSEDKLGGVLHHRGLSKTLLENARKLIPDAADAVASVMRNFVPPVERDRLARLKFNGEQWKVLESLAEQDSMTVDELCFEIINLHVFATADSPFKTYRNPALKALVQPLLENEIEDEAAAEDSDGH